MSAEMAVVEQIGADFTDAEIDTALRVVRAVTDRFNTQEGGENR